jgi:cytochrome c oxidase cbb3-type subunit 4
MLRFIKHNLTSIDGISIYPIISLLIFFLFFAFMLTYVLRMKKTEINELSNIPLDSNKEESIIDVV